MQDRERLMATATKIIKRTAEFTLILSNAEAHELLYYLATRPTGLHPDTGTRTTNGIHDALRESVNSGDKLGRF